MMGDDKRERRMLAAEMWRYGNCRSAPHDRLTNVLLITLDVPYLLQDDTYNYYL